MLLDGLYAGASNRGFVFNGRNLVVRSANGPAGCVIDLESAGRAFLIANGENAAARIEGLTILRGGPAGAQALDAGAAIKVSGASPTIVACSFEQNTAVNGGAVSLTNSDALVRGCSFRANTASMFVGRGGALSVSNGHPRIVGCTFVENSSESGGAISLIGNSGTGLVVSHCVFHKNSVARYGGAAFVSFQTAVFEHCLFTENRGNAGNSQGGAIFVSNQALVGFSSCTIARNTTTLHGSGIYVSPSAAGTLRDSIVWGNTGPSPQIALLGSGPETASLAVAYCDVEGGEAAVYQNGSTMLTWGAGNIDVEPAFVDSDGIDDDPSTLNDNDWRLLLASPCIDAGDNALVAIDWADIDGDGNTSELAPLDLDLAPRFADVASVPDTGNGSAPIVDIG